MQFLTIVHHVAETKDMLYGVESQVRWPINPTTHKSDVDKSDVHKSDVYNSDSPLVRIIYVFECYNDHSMPDNIFI